MPFFKLNFHEQDVQENSGKPVPFALNSVGEEAENRAPWQWRVFFTKPMSIAKFILH